MMMADPSLLQNLKRRTIEEATTHGVKVLVGVIVLAVSLAVGTYLRSQLPSVWDWLTSPYSLSRGTWIAVALVGLALVTIATRLRIKRRKWSPYEEYYRDEFGGVVWRWEWTRRRATDLVAYCARCDEYCVVRESEDNPFEVETISCSRRSCQWDVEPIETLAELQARAAQAFERKARTGEWEEVVESYGQRPNDW